jgi:deoxycytidine triphosphate deaminase
MSIKADRWIRRMALEQGMIEPFVDTQVREGIISYGLTSYGYDMRVTNQFKVFTNVYNVLVDPKNFNPRSFVDIEADHIDIPPNSFALAQSFERFRIPRNVSCIVIGKSTYARCGIIINVTPLEPCFSDDTEILTTAGWVMIKDVQIGEKVLAMRSDGIAEWQPVERKQVYPYEGDLIHFKGRSIDMLVTPDHKVVVRRRTNPKSDNHEFTPWHTTEASNVYGGYNYEMTREVRWEGGDIADMIDINGLVVPTNPFLEFLGAYLGDGWSYINNRGYVIHLAAFKNREVEYFADILERLGIHFARTAKGYMFHSKAIYEFLHPLGHAHEKYIPAWVKELPSEQLHYLLLGLMNSDGNNQTETYTTVSRLLADDVQEVIFKCGYAATVRQAKPETREHKLNGNVIKNNYPVYKVRISRSHLTPKIAPNRHALVPYNGFVYDVTVPSHIIFVRRNGKAVWSGNCWEGYVTIEISNTTPLPARIYANEGIGQVLFFEGDEPCERSYADKKGKYQNQVGIVLPRIDKEQS